MPENFKSLLQRAREEIITLRRANEILSAKQEMIDLFAVVLNTQPAYRNQAATEDVAWLLQREIDNIDAVKEPG